MRKLSLAIVVLSVMVFAPCAHAMDLSLNTAVDMILNQSQDLKKAAANVKKAEASLDAVNANRWFKIEGTATYMNVVDMENPFKSYSIDIPPEIGAMVSAMTQRRISAVLIKTELPK